MKKQLELYNPKVGKLLCSETAQYLCIHLSVYDDQIPYFKKHIFIFLYYTGLIGKVNKDPTAKMKRN